MPLQIEKTFPRLWSIHSGVAMIVTDLHGNWDVYQRYRDRFIQLLHNGEADCLIFTGDLIHSSSDSVPDKSLEIIVDFLELQAGYGDRVIFLCGNHELPHIYGFGLGKGEKEFTPPFEAALSRTSHRSAVINLFMSLPFYLRTAAGVTITHAGAIEAINDPETALKLFTWDHKAYIAKADALLAEMDVEGMRRAYAKLSGAATYDELARHYLAVNDADDPRYDDLLRGMLVTMYSDFKHLRSALFTKCESEIGKDAYSDIVVGFLEVLSKDFRPQHLLVAGHIEVPGSYQIVGKNHFRLASGSHATPLKAGQYLLLDTEKPVEEVERLLNNLYDIQSIKTDS
jgi:hypothetical protein